MAEERRSAPRAHVSGVRVTYDSAAGDHVETHAVNLARGGLFVATAKPLPVGKRIAIEIEVVGEPEPWSALGRVVWSRHQPTDRLPAGMGVKLIDVDDAIASAVDKLLDVGEHTEPGVGVAPNLPEPSRPPPPAASPVRIIASAPVVSIPPGAERTILGVGSAAPEPQARELATARVDGPKPAGDVVGPREVSRRKSEPSAARNPSVVIDLVPKGTDARTREAHDIPGRDSPPKRARASRWLLVLLLLAIAGVAAYVLLDGDIDRFLKMSDRAPPPAAPAISPPPFAQERLAPAPGASFTAATAGSAGGAPFPAIPAASAPSLFPVSRPPGGRLAAPSPPTVIALGGALGSGLPPAGARRFPSGMPNTFPSARVGLPAAGAIRRRPGSEDNPY